MLEKRVKYLIGDKVNFGDGMEVHLVEDTMMMWVKRCQFFLAWRLFLLV